MLPAEFARLQQLNADYNARFGFPFILAVGPTGTGLSKQQIIEPLRGAWTTTPTLSRPKRCATSTALRDPPERQVRRRTAAGRRCMDWHEKLAEHSDPGYAERASSPSPTSPTQHRACAQRISHWMRDCGFDEVEIDAGQRGGPPSPGHRRSALSSPAALRHGAQWRQVRRAPGHFRAHGLRARTAPRRLAPAVRH